jgi:predicted transcriptional regulator
VAETIVIMAMTLRLTDAEAQVLRKRAELEQRPVRKVVRQAIREYVERHPRTEPFDQAVEEGLLRYAEVLERLGDS